MSAPHDNSNGSPAANRPEFAIVLGLLPPYTLDDVKRAYLAKVKDAHPDRGGDRAAFDRIQQAYEQAGAYLSFRGDRRQWIAARMDEYVAVEALIGRLRDLGAEVETTLLDWVKQSFGDFASLTQSIIGVRAGGATNVADLLDTMVRERAILSGLKRLDLSGCPVDDLLAIQLRAFSSLVHLDLSRTQITGRALAVVDWLRQLEEFNLEGTAVGWWPRRKLAWRLARRRGTRPADALHPVNIR
jgi:hypothetical protein